MGRIGIVPWPPALGPAAWALDGTFSGKVIQEIRYNESTGMLYAFSAGGQIYRRDGANNWTMVNSNTNRFLYGGAYPVTAYWGGDIYWWASDVSNNACIYKMAANETITKQWSNYYWRFSCLMKGVGVSADLMTPDALNYDTTQTGQRLNGGAWSRPIGPSGVYNTIAKTHEEPFGNYYVIGGGSKLHDYDVSASSGAAYTEADEATNDLGSWQFANWSGKIWAPRPATPQIYSLATIGGSWATVGVPSGMTHPTSLHGAGEKLYAMGRYLDAGSGYYYIGIAAYDGSAWTKEYQSSLIWVDDSSPGVFSHDASAPYACYGPYIWRRSRL